MKPLSRTAAADLAASSTTHARSALVAKLSACRRASRHLLSFSSTAVRWDATGRHAPVERAIPPSNSTRPRSASGPRVERVSAGAVVPSPAASVVARTPRSSRSKCKVRMRNGDVTGPMLASRRRRTASGSNRTATMSAMPCAAGTSPTTRCAPPRGINRWTWLATSAVISASQRNRPRSRSAVAASTVSGAELRTGSRRGPERSVVTASSIWFPSFAAAPRGSFAVPLPVALGGRRSSRRSKGSCTQATSRHGCLGRSGASCVSSSATTAAARAGTAPDSSRPCSAVR